MGRKRVIMSSMAMTAVVIVGMVLAGRSALFVLFIALAGFFLYGTRPVLQAWVLDTAPKNLAGSAIGLQFAVGAIGSAISPALCGMIADKYDLFTAFYYLAGTIVIANLFVLFLPDTRPTEAESRSPAAQGAE
jgi:MFS transporter, FSR family, fosmidomycin resistance protein